MKLNAELFRDELDSWFEKLYPLFENGEMDRIFTNLKSRSKEGYKILPESTQVFRCFQATPYEELKVVMCALAPYHTIRQDKCVADG